ncbi:uncharacterized protein DNG_02418 [Cephalotrichum gorgonifer]|uniref:Peptidase S8/S53 domain-containing protein n=1 Tax=Cephalotrichum gorgonifer TaxID=2041049 RepID=A0AAE8MTJ1_9PEZI|nr:uncharacterized protein DNG_02418 [Cephalotrichum gorgonifer]
MAYIAQINEVDKEAGIFYRHLRYHCLRFQDYILRTRQTSSETNSLLVNQTLLHLSSLVPKSNLHHEPLRLDVTPEARLRALNSNWADIRKDNDSVKIEFVRLWLMLGASEDVHRVVDDALESCADSLEKQQQPDYSVKKSAETVDLDIGEPSYVVWKTAQSIFDALTHCRGCSCHTEHGLGAKLELGTYRKPEKKVDKTPAVRSTRGSVRASRGNCNTTGGLDFDLFLSMDQDHDWNEVRVQTARKAVGIQLPGEVSHREAGVARGSSKVGVLCDPIARTKKMGLQRLVLKLTSGQLFNVRSEKSNFEIDKTAEPISLSQCLEERPEFFIEKVKRILSLIVSCAVLHLNNTSWLQPGWGSANIKFFQIKSCKTPLRPFIQTQLPKTTPDSQPVVESDDGDEYVWDDLNSGHQCPSLIALAVVLIEVYFVKPFKRLAENHGISPVTDPTGRGRIPLMDVEQVYSCVVDEIPKDSLLLTALDNCLDPGLWENEEGATLDISTLKSRIYQNVVRPLENYLACGYKIPLDEVDNYARDLDFGRWGQAIAGHGQDGYATAVPPWVLTPSRTPSPESMWASAGPANNHSTRPDLQSRGHQYTHLSPSVSYPASYPVRDTDTLSNSEISYAASQFFDDEMGNGGFSEVAETKRYLAWKSRYEDVYNQFISPYLPGPSSSEPVRVAILDTGFDRDHYAFEAREANIKGKRNFYDETKKNVPDRNGHGTFTASLILDYAPDVELYVVKIADKENARPDAKIVANAINHSVEAWNVDIISMSFGWPSSDFDGYDSLVDAIDNAYGKKVLMFAAAANSGARLGRAYPASSPHVVCVHSTNTDGDASRFSPTAEPNAINIATVGESVESAWPTLLCHDDQPDPKRTRSGTSYATPIIAGIAAFLLQYARLHLPENAAAMLKRKDRMEALLRRCAERGPNYSPRDGYFYVELSLHGHNLFGQELDGVSRDILRALRI